MAISAAPGADSIADKPRSDKVAADSRQSEIASYPIPPLHHTTTYSRLHTILVITQDRYLLALSQFMKNRFEASVQVLSTSAPLPCPEPTTPLLSSPLSPTASHNPRIPVTRILRLPHRSRRHVGFPIYNFPLAVATNCTPRTYKYTTGVGTPLNPTYTDAGLTKNYINIQDPHIYHHTLHQYMDDLSAVKVSDDDGGRGRL